MTDALSGGQQGLSSRAARRRRARRRVGGAAALAAALGLGAGWAWLGTATPLVTVMSPSMAPTLEVGQIALMGTLRGVPEVGDVVEVPVPADIQRERNYPRSVVHRIVEISDGVAVTQGDNLGDPDPFEVPLGDIDRRLVTVVPGAGRLVSFLFSPFGLIWIGSGVALFLVYPQVERSRERHQVEQVETKATLQHVVAAVADYGYHLQSHTAILQAMSQAAQDLSAVVGRLELTAAPGSAVTAPAPIVVRAQPVVERPIRRERQLTVTSPRPVRARPLVAAGRQAAPPPSPRPPRRARPLRARPLQARRPVPQRHRPPAVVHTRFGPRPARTRPLTAR